MIKKLLLLLPLLGGISSSDNYTLGTKFLDSKLKYNVKDYDRQLEAELKFPAEVLAIVFGFKHNLEVGSLSLNVEHSIYSKSKTGKDTDWHEGELTVYSESDTKLDNYFRFSLGYDYPLLKNTIIGIELFHEDWKMTWSNTKQIRYTNNTYSEVSGETVKYKQELNGFRFKLGYEDNLFGKSYKVFAGYDLAYTHMKDQHLKRSIYTKSQAWMDGYYLNAEIELLSYKSSQLKMSASYKKMVVSTDMDYFFESGGKYMTLPAKYETVISSIGVNYIYKF